MSQSTTAANCKFCRHVLRRAAIIRGSPRNLAAMDDPLFGLAIHFLHASDSRLVLWVLRVCSKITSDFGGSAAWPEARREEGASPPVGCDRRATKQMARRRPAPEGWGGLAVWRRCPLLTDPRTVWSSLAPTPRAK